MRLTLPYPPSANRYWRHFRGRTVVSAEARDYRRWAACLARDAGARGVFRGRVHMTLVLRPKKPLRAGKGPPRSIDLDNALKVALDALQRVVYENDSQVDDIRLRRGESVPGGALEVDVWEVTG